MSRRGDLICFDLISLLLVTLTIGIMASGEQWSGVSTCLPSGERIPLSLLSVQGEIGRPGVQLPAVPFGSFLTVRRTQHISHHRPAAARPNIFWNKRIPLNLFHSWAFDARWCSPLLLYPDWIVREHHPTIVSLQYSRESKHWTFRAVPPAAENKKKSLKSTGLITPSAEFIDSFFK